MKKKNSFNYVNHEINFSDAFKKIWREKILFFVVTIGSLLLVNIFLFFQHTRSTTPIDYNYSEFNISFNDNNLLKHYPTIVTLFDIELRSSFSEDFNKILLSLDNMEQFLKQSKNYDNFNEFLKSRKISSLDYFIDNKFGEFINKDDKNSSKRYYLILPLNVDANKYANEYFEFSKIKAINLKKKSILEIINSNIKKLNLSLQLEKKNFFPGNELIFSNEKKYDNFKNPELIQEQVVILKQIYNEIENDVFDLQIFLEPRANRLIKNNNNQVLYSFAAIISGFFFSLVIIFFKNIIKSI
jgi:hypothetical protein